MLKESKTFLRLFRCRFVFLFFWIQIDHHGFNLVSVTLMHLYMIPNDKAWYVFLTSVEFIQSHRAIVCTGYNSQDMVKILSSTGQNRIIFFLGKRTRSQHLSWLQSMKGAIKAWFFFFSLLDVESAFQLIAKEHILNMSTLLSALLSVSLEL